MSLLTRSDLHLVVRLARRTPGLTLVATLALAVAIAASTAAFVVVRGVLLAELPVPRASELVMVRDWEQARGFDLYLDRDELARRREATSSWSALAAFAESTFSVQPTAGAARVVRGAAVSADAFPTLAVRPRVG